LKISWSVSPSRQRESGSIMHFSLNTQIAMKFQEMSDLLLQQGANPFRIKAYRQAAVTLSELGQDVAEIFQQEGNKGLEALPGIGRGIATAIAEIVTTGRWAQLERLRGSLDPSQLFQTVPGIGPELAAKIHDELHIDTLEALEIAAYDGSLKKLKDIGSRRLDDRRHRVEVMGQRQCDPSGWPLHRGEDLERPPWAQLAGELARPHENTDVIDAHGGKRACLGG